MGIKSSKSWTIIILFLVLSALLISLDYLRYKKQKKSLIWSRLSEDKEKQPHRPEKKTPSGVTTEKSRISERKKSSDPANTSEVSPREKPVVAIIIDDVGYDMKNLKKLLNFSEPLTLSILPYSPHAMESARLIHKKGKEVMLHLPMEPEDYPEADPGKGAILTSMTESEIAAIITGDLQRVPFAKGVNNHMGSKATADEDTMRNTLRNLQGLFFVDSRTTTATMAYELAKKMNIPTAEKTLFIDHEVDTKYAVDKIMKLGEKALKNGSALGIGHNKENTYKALKIALPRLEKKGVNVVSASRIAE